MAQLPWQPSASWALLQQRAKLLQQIRGFFAERGVTEVDTPLLCRFGVTDRHLENLTSRFAHRFPAGHQQLQLQTSPEYAMKRILAAYQQSIYQLSHVVRDDEVGRYHNPEFMLLEWYRVGFDDRQLAQEVEALLQLTCDAPAAKYLSYQQAFIDATGHDPLTDSGISALRRDLTNDPKYRDWIANEDDSTVLQVAFYEWVESAFAPHQPVCITHFPKAQAALAKIAADDPRTAHRFEFYYRGVELANGYFELTDVEEQRQRFAEDNRLRQQHGQPPKAADEYLLAALEHGLPSCAGVALGFDRLLMIATGAEHIEEVLAFTTASA
ncbi:elongation factor P lysine(34) lysyltransferase [Idiomarina tyrosinivorans]|uniref:Elongation factor P lysine(34) lysyltransferase n=1 Tax=Idiomarina tyrosinivorans TaxID=1445662 RepID=A0A432ZFD7_9GAMM|nr:EF-P lysine aminoacylase EpmA [Idiomarina tyrosinivorans]RUO76619.1 elongation factor P lysine(34) lysyltransferase [Idiomarina tyrosinivorans]